MTWDGTGNYNRTNGTNTGATLWADDKAAAVKITTDRHDTHDQDLATAINACITKNNESKPTAHFLPNVDASYNLGSALKQWADGFFSGTLTGSAKVKDADGNVREGFKNLLIGSDLTRNPWQRGTSFTITVSDTYFADRHTITFDGTANITAEKVSLGTAQKIMGVWCIDAMKITINSKSGNTYIRHAQRIEDVTSIENQSSILSAGIQGSASFTVPMQLKQDFGTTGSPSADVVTPFDADLSVTSSLQLLTTGLTIPTVSGKTIGSDGIHTSFAAVEYDLINVPATGYVIIPIHQFQKGSIATDFDQGPPRFDPQRYFEVGDRWHLTYIGAGQATLNDAVAQSFIVQKRAIPAIVLSNTGSLQGDGTLSVDAFIYVDSFTTRMSVGRTTTGVSRASFTFTSDAELYE